MPDFLSSRKRMALDYLQSGPQRIGKLPNIGVKVIDALVKENLIEEVPESGMIRSKLTRLYRLHPLQIDFGDLWVE